MVKKLLKFLTGRVVITGALILVQAAWLLLLLFQLLEDYAWLGMAFTALSIVMALYVINKDDNPAYKIAWLLFITLLPLMGGPMYLLFGNKRPARRLRAALEREYKRTRPLLDQHPGPMEVLEASSPRKAGTARYIAGQGRGPLWQDTQVDYYALGDQMFPAMLADLEQARHFIFLEYFIIGEGEMWGKILEILKVKAREGVDVRLLYDDVGSVSLLPVEFPRQMEALGIHCIAFNRFVPWMSLVMNNRDHRKILVVDGYVGYTGGINLADEYINRVVKYGHWKDTALRLEGEAVWNLTVMFLEMWNALRFTDGDFAPFRPHVHHPQPFLGQGWVQPFGDTPLDDEPLAENIYIEVLNQAQRYVYIYTPYLLIDSEMQIALCLAAHRGVDVKLFTPGIPDKKLVYQLTRSYYPPLLRAGVEIYEYAPGFLHGKSFVSDDQMAVVGTVNLDYRSLYLHFECGAVLYDCPCIRSIRQDALDLLSRCRRVTLDDCRHGLAGGLLNAVLRLFSPLL